MVRIINYQKRQTEEGKEFFILELQGGIEMVKSRQSGKFYITAKPKNVLAEIKVSYSINNASKEKIDSGDKAFEALYNFWTKGTIELYEEFKAILLNRSNEALGIYPLSKGGITSTVVDVRLLFAIALKCDATGIIISHNHPSGNLNPSKEDITLTRKIKQCSDFLDISLIDHIIITKYGYYSFANAGLI